MKKYLLFFFLLFPLLCKSQFYIKVSGLVTDYFTGIPLNNSLVTLNDTMSYVTEKNGYYEFIIQRGNYYKLAYSKKDYITKYVSINATGVPLKPDVPFFDMDVQMTLFEPIPDFDFDFFQIPLGEAQYKRSTRNMSWDNEYSNTKKEELAIVMKEYTKSYKGYYARKGEEGVDVDSVLEQLSDSEYKNDVLSQFPQQDTMDNYYDVPNVAPAQQVENKRGLFWTVQVGVYSKPVQLDKLYNITPLNSELMDNYKIRYTTGIYLDEVDAEVRRQQIIKLGVEDAFLVCYLNGKRIPIQHAKNLFEIHGSEILLDSMYVTKP